MAQNGQKRTVLLANNMGSEVAPAQAGFDHSPARRQAPSLGQHLHISYQGPEALLFVLTESGVHC